MTDPDRHQLDQFREVNEPVTDLGRYQLCQCRKGREALADKGCNQGEDCQVLESPREHHHPALVNSCRRPGAFGLAYRSLPGASAAQQQLRFHLPRASRDRASAAQQQLRFHLPRASRDQTSPWSLLRQLLRFHLPRSSRDQMSPSPPPSHRQALLHDASFFSFSCSCSRPGVQICASLLVVVACACLASLPHLHVSCLEI